MNTVNSIHRIPNSADSAAALWFVRLGFVRHWQMRRTGELERTERNGRNGYGKSIARWKVPEDGHCIRKNDHLRKPRKARKIVSSMRS